MKHFAFLALSLGLLSGCANHHEGETTPKLDINFSAAYVVNGESNSLSVINLSEKIVKNEIKLGAAGHSGTDHTSSFSYPHHININKSKTKLAIGVPNMDLSEGHDAHGGTSKGNIVIVDAKTGEILKVLELTKPNHNAIFSPNDQEIWTSQMDMDGKVLVYDANTYTLKNTISVGMMPAEITFSFDGLTAFATNGEDGTVTAIKVADKTVIKTIKVGENPVGAWTGADNKNYCDNEMSKTVSVINNATLTVENTINLGFTPDFVAYMPTSQEVWVTGGKEGKVNFYKLVGSNYTKTGELATGAGAHAIQFTGDLKTAYITNQSANTVSVIDVATKSKIKDIPVGVKPNGIIINF